MLSARSPELERDDFGFAPCIEIIPRGPFGDIAALRLDEPLPFAADMHIGPQFRDGHRRSRLELFYS
jgi:hypothetical protein